MITYKTISEDKADILKDGKTIGTMEKINSQYYVDFDYVSALINGETVPKYAEMIARTVNKYTFPNVKAGKKMKIVE